MKRGLDHLIAQSIEDKAREGDPDMFLDYEDYEDSYENICGAKPGQRYG